MLSSYASFEWHDDPQFEEYVDEVMELEFHLDASEETLRSILEGLDSTKDGKIDKNELGNELSKLGLEDIDFAFERLGLTGASLEDERTLQIFREAVFMQLALEKIRASQEQTIGFEVRIDILDYNQFVTNHFGGFGWSNEPRSSLDFSPTGLRRSNLGHARAMELWEDFLRMPRLQHGFYTVPPDTEADAKETPAKSQARMDTTSVPITRWINIDGLDKTILRQLALRFKLDPLAIEDALQKERRPQAEEYDHGLFLVVPMLEILHTKDGTEEEKRIDSISRSSVYHSTKHVDPEKYASSSIDAFNNEKKKTADKHHSPTSPELDEVLNFRVKSESIAIFVVDSECTVITVQERRGDCWQDIRNRRLRKKYSRIRKHNHNFLLYALLDATVDALFPKIKWVLDQIHALDEELNNCTPADLTNFDIAAVRNVRKQLSVAHQALRPLREVLQKAQNDVSFRFLLSHT